MLQMAPHGVLALMCGKVYCILPTLFCGLINLSSHGALDQVVVD